MSDDYSLGDVRQSYSNIGGPAAKHAQTHDIRHEQLTNPMGPGPVDTGFAGQMDPGTPWEPGSYEDTNSAAVDDKDLHDRLPQRSNDEFARNERLIASQQTDCLLWNRLACEDAEPAIERP